MKNNINKIIFIDRFIRFGILAFLMIIFGALTWMKIIVANYSSTVNTVSLSTILVQILQAITLPITGYISIRAYHSWHVAKRLSHRLNGFWVALSYSGMVAFALSFIYLGFEKKPPAFFSVFVLLMGSLLATIFGGAFIGGILASFMNRSKSRIFLPALIFLLTPFLVGIIVLFPATVATAAITDGISSQEFKELFALQIIIGGWIISWFFLGFLGLKMRQQHERHRMILVRCSDQRLQPAYELAEKMLSALGYQPRLREHYVALEAAIQVLYPGDCLFLPPIFSNILLTRLDRFVLVFKNALEKEPFPWVLSCMLIQKSGEIDEMPSMFREEAMSLIEYKTLQNRDDLAQKVRNDLGPDADTVVFQTVYQNGNHLLREGRVVEAAELAVDSIANAISQETQIEILLSSYRIAQMAGREDMSIKILSEFRKRELIQTNIFGINERWGKFLNRIPLLYDPFQPLIPLPSRFTESTLASLEAEYYVKAACKGRLHQNEQIQKDALNMVRRSLDDAWKNINFVAEQVALANICRSELHFSMEMLEDSEKENQTEILQDGLSFWYLHVLLGPVSNILLSQRSDALKLRVKGVQLVGVGKPKNSNDRIALGQCLWEWIEGKKWDRVLMKDFSLEGADFEGWQHNTSGLQPYPMGAPSCVAAHLIDLARLLHKAGRYEAAHQVLIYASPFVRESLSPATRRDMAMLSGEINMCLGRSDAALSDLEEALTESTLVALDLRSEEQVIDFNAENAHLYNLLIWEHFKREEFDTCLTLLERGRSESLAIMMRHKVDALEDTDKGKDENWTQLEALRTKIFEMQSRCSVVKDQKQRDMLFLEKKAEELAGSAEGVMTQTETNLTKLQQQLTELEREYRLMMEKLMVQRSPDLDYLQNPPPFEELRATLQEDEGFLVVHDDGRNCLWLFATQDQVSGHNVPDQARLLAHDLIKGLRSPQTPMELLDDLTERLSNSTLTPLFESIDKLNFKDRRIYFVPMGIWSELPLALLKEKNTKLDSEEWKVATLPSAAIRHYLSPIGPISGVSALGVGNPSLGSPEFDLPFADQEVRLLGKIFPGGRVLRGKEATIDAFLGGLEKNPRIVHIACHGEFKPDQPMLSALRFTPSDKDDGVLHGYRIRYHGLGSNVDLCVLSACWSGRSSVAGFNEQIGLSRTLLGAGASSLITSLWAIDDQSTTLFFEKFYEFINKVGPAESLEIARDHLREKTGYKHPYYWAPFIWTGSL